MLLEADFYVPHGKFQPHVLDIDENYTMGEMERVRREILARLAAEGLLDAQRSLSLPAAPLRVGLVTAAGSAAAHDFAKVIAGSGFPVEVLLENARMQGAETAPTVAAAIAALEARDVDCVCVVRGGGSRSDLAWFDDERLRNGNPHRTSVEKRRALFGLYCANAFGLRRLEHGGSPFLDSKGLHSDRLSHAKLTSAHYDVVRRGRNAGRSPVLLLEPVAALFARILYLHRESAKRDNQRTPCDKTSHEHENLLV